MIHRIDQNLLWNILSLKGWIFQNCLKTCAFWENTCGRNAFLCFGQIWHNRIMCFYGLFNFHYSEPLVGVNIENSFFSRFLKNIILQFVRNCLNFMNILFMLYVILPIQLLLLLFSVRTLSSKKPCSLGISVICLFLLTKVLLSWFTLISTFDCYFYLCSTNY